MIQKASADVTIVNLDDSHAFLKKLGEESDRGLALIACCSIDEIMRKILLAFLLDKPVSTKIVDGFNAPIGSLATRSALVFALGLISEQEFKECEIFRKIRNLFAHKTHMSFKDPEVVELCARLTMFANKGELAEAQASEPRYRFITAAALFLFNIVNRPAFAAQRKCVHRYWPIDDNHTLFPDPSFQKSADRKS